MRKPTERGKKIRAFIVHSIPSHPRDLVDTVRKKFRISRQATNRYVHELSARGLITATGKTSQRRYSLSVLEDKQFEVPLAGLEEDRLWRQEVSQTLNELPKNVSDIWHYAFTEMVNNAVDHSGGRLLTVTIRMNALLTEISVHDDGVGIFRKIKEECKLEDERHAVLELAKGKLTTDPANHTGEGIFFTSRMLDRFEVLSGDVFFSHKHGENDDWILERERPVAGTSVYMELDNSSERIDRQVFDQFASSEDDYGFTKTIVPVRLARHGVESLVSRSQAKRLLTRVDRFKTVVLDFEDVDSIGQAFADEIFRVFERDHPGVLILTVNASPRVQTMIARARANSAPGED